MGLVSLLSPNTSSGFIWGLGPTFIFPTASDNALGQGKWQIGPAAVGLYLGSCLTRRAPRAGQRRP